MNQAFFEKLIAIPSVTSDVAMVNKATEAMREYLASSGIYCSMEELEGRKILFASTEEGKACDFLLNAHLDVVAAEPAMFEPRVADGVMRARGTHDCKGPAVAVAETLLRSKGRASVGAVFSADEETGGRTTGFMVGAGYSARRGICVVDSNGYSIATAQKGVLSCVVRAKGRGGHSSAPWSFDNAAEKLMDAYARLREVLPKPPADAADDHWFDTCALTILKSGSVHNRIPDVAEMTLNIRYVEPGADQKYLKLIRDASGLEVEPLEICPPVVCDAGNPFILSLKKAMEERWKDKDIFLYKMMGATDARHFEPIGVPIAVIGLDGDGAHSDDEWVRLASIDETADMLTSFFCAM